LVQENVARASKEALSELGMTMGPGDYQIGVAHGRPLQKLGPDIDLEGRTVIDSRFHPMTGEVGHGISASRMQGGKAW
jgi:hypothetical protein